MITKSIIDILLEKKIITSAQALECKTKAQETGMAIEQCLIEGKYVTDQDLAKAYAEQLGWPYVEKVTDAMADLTILAKIPLKFCRQYGDSGNG